MPRPTSPSPQPPDKTQISEYVEHLIPSDGGRVHTEGFAFLSMTCAGLAWLWSQASLDLAYILLTLACAYLIVNYVLHPALAKWRTKKYEQLPCPHNIAGGYTGHHCNTCVDYIQHQKARRLYDQKLIEWRDEIRRTARRLAAKEKRRLANMIRRDYGNFLRLSPRAFEDLVSDLFRHMGYDVTQTPFTNDRGRDAIAKIDGKTYLVECKRYDRRRSVGRRDLQVFHSAIVEEGAVGGFFVNTGRFARTAQEFVEGKAIELIDESQMVDLMMQHMPYNAEEIDAYEAMCTVCGSIVEFRLSRPGANYQCLYGHKMEPSLTQEGVEKAVTDNVRAGSRRRRRRRRFY